MAWARKCDRCGKLFEEKYNTYIELKTSSDEDRTVELDCGMQSSLDLCPDCIESFKHWWTEKGTSFKEYFNEQMKDPEFRKEYRKAEKESKEKYYVTEHFKMELRDVIYRKGEPACVISKTLGLPGDCITKIITGYTKKMTKDRYDWICEALAIDKEV